MHRDILDLIVETDLRWMLARLALDLDPPEDAERVLRSLQATYLYYAASRLGRLYKDLERWLAGLGLERRG